MRGWPLLNKSQRVAGETMMALRTTCEGRSQDNRLSGDPAKKLIKLVISELSHEQQMDKDSRFTHFLRCAGLKENNNK